MPLSHQVLHFQKTDARLLDQDARKREGRLTMGLFGKTKRSYPPGTRA